MGFQIVDILYNFCLDAEVLKTRGISADSAGWMVSLLAICAITNDIIVPILAGKVKDQRWVWVSQFYYLLGYGGIMVGGTALVPLWMIMIGIAGGAAFGLTMMFLHYAHGHHMRLRIYQVWHSLSAIRFAAIGPGLFGLLHDFHPVGQSRCIIIGATLIILLSGMKAGKNAFVTSEVNK